MVTQYVAALELPVSRQRLEGCRPAGSDDLSMVATYLWNRALAEALYSPLQVLEIALRNSIHATLSRYFQTPSWFDMPGLLLTNEFDELNRAKRKLLQGNRPLDPGRIIAETTFGFWTAILRQPYNARIWKRWMYGPLIDAFPHIPRRQRDREKIWRRIDAQRVLRNRVFHYEPIWNRPTLWNDHEELCTIVGWISPEMGVTLNRIDRFPHVFLQAHGEIENTIKDHLGIS